MFKNKITFSLMVSIPSVIITPFIVTSCSTSGNQIEEVPTNKNQIIKAKSNLEAKDFGWESKTTQEVIDNKLITNQFIVDNKSKIFDGSTNLLTSSNDIESLTVKETNNTSLGFIFNIKSGKYYNENGEISTQPKVIEVVIKNFMENSANVAAINKAIESLKTSLKTTSEVQNIKPSVVNVENFSTYISGLNNQGNISVELIHESLTPNDDSGVLSFDVKLTIGNYSKTQRFQFSNFNSNEKIVQNTIKSLLDESTGLPKLLKANNLGSNMKTSEVTSESLINCIDELKNIGNNIKLSFEIVQKYTDTGYLEFNCTFTLGGYSKTIENFSATGFKKG